MKVAITEDDWKEALRAHLPSSTVSRVVEAVRIHAAQRLLRESMDRTDAIARSLDGLTGKPWWDAQMEFDRERERQKELEPFAFPSQAEQEGRS